MSENVEVLKSHILQMVEQAAADAAEDDGVLKQPESFRAKALELFTECGVSLSTLYELVLWVAISLCVRLNRSLEALKDVERTLKQHLTCERVYSKPFEVGTNGETMRFIYTSPAGREGGGFNCVALPDHLDAPPLLSFVFTAEGKRLEGPAPTPPLTQDTYVVVSAAEQSVLAPDLGELAMTVAERRTTRYVLREVARDIQQRLERGEKVTVLCDHKTASQIFDSEKARDEFVKFLPEAGETLDDVILARSLRAEIERYGDLLLKGIGFRILLVGPTGGGKTMTVEALLRSVGLKTKKPVAIYTVGAAWTGSEYVDRAEINMRLVFEAAEAAAKRGHIVGIHIPEIDGLVGARGQRYEGSHNRSIRDTLQELLSKDLAGVAVIATKNYLRDSFLPDTIERRLTPIEFKRPTRKQLAAVAAKYASPWAGVLDEQLGMTPEQLGDALADGLNFLVARCHFFSGQVLPIRARDLTTACPAKMESLAVEFCRDLQQGVATSLFDLFARIERQFHAIDISDQNVFEVTHLNREAYVHDTVKLVQRVGAADTVRAEAIAC